MAKPKATETGMGVSMGRIVMFHIAPGEKRPAMVVRVRAVEVDLVDLQVFTRGNSDADLVTDAESLATRTGVPGVVHRTSIARGDDVGMWNWPERF